MTQHLRTGRTRTGHTPAKYRTACGRWVTSAQANGPGGVTCRACLSSAAYREAGQ